MPFPAELIGEIQIAVDNVLADGQLNPQQQTESHSKNQRRINQSNRSDP